MTSAIPTQPTVKPPRPERGASVPFAESEQAINPDRWATLPSTYYRWKLLPGRIIAVIILIIVSPLLAALIVAIRLTSPGPALYRQTRVGLNGKPFAICKLRTMRQDAERGTGAVWARKDDPRVTPLGRVLRKLHLDELPQLINVIRGEMTLVGPRPERPEFVAVLAREVPGYLDRLRVPPGVTGLAQVNLPPDEDIESVRGKLSLDLEYIRRASFSLDIRLMACTLLRLVGVPQNVGTCLCGTRSKAYQRPSSV